MPTMITGRRPSRKPERQAGQILQMEVAPVDVERQIGSVPAGQDPAERLGDGGVRAARRLEQDGGLFDGLSGDVVVHERFLLLVGGCAEEPQARSDVMDELRLSHRVAQVEPALAQAVAHGLDREAGRVLDAVEALLLDRDRQRAMVKELSRGQQQKIAVARIINSMRSPREGPRS